MVWICPVCSTCNEEANTQCIVCDEAKPTSVSTGTPDEQRLDKFKEIQEIYRKQLAQADEQRRENDYNLGKVFLVLNNEEKAAEYLTMAADAGHAQAAYELALLYYSAKSLRFDPDKVFYYFSLANELGCEQAQCYLGTCYYYGHGTEVNYKKAVELYRTVADRGDPAGCYSLGYCYYLGHGVTQNYEYALFLFADAAQKKNANAAYMMGYCYEFGTGVSVDRSVAILWYQNAASLGSTHAKDALSRLGAK